MSPNTQPTGIAMRSWVDPALVAANQRGIITPEQRAMLGVIERRPLGCALFFIFGLLMLIPVSLVFLALYFSSVAQNTQLTESIVIAGVIVFIILGSIFITRFNRHRARIALWRAVETGEIEHEQGDVIKKNRDYIAQVGGVRQLKLSALSPILPPSGAYTFYYLSETDHLLSIAPLYPQSAPTPGHTPVPSHTPYPTYAAPPYAQYPVPTPAHTPYPTPVPAPIYAPYAAPVHHGIATPHSRSRRKSSGCGCISTLVILITIGVLVFMWFTGAVYAFISPSTVTTMFSFLPRSDYRLTTHDGHKDWINATTWSPDGKRVASAGRDGTVQIWDAVTGTLTFSYKGHQHTDQSFPQGTYGVNTVAWSPDGKKIVSGGMDNETHIWSAEPSTLGKLLLSQKEKQVKRVVWSPDSQMLASTMQTEIVIWKADNGAVVTTYTEHNRCPVTAVWAPQGNRIASGGCDGSLRVWDALSKQVVLSYFYSNASDVYDITWSPDGTRIAATAADNTVRVWHVESKRVIMRKSNIDAVAIAWSHDGRHLAFGYGSDYLGWVIVWNAETGKQIAKFGEQPQDGPVGAVRTMAWSPDDRSIALGGKTGLVKIWQL